MVDSPQTRTVHPLLHPLKVPHLLPFQTCDVGYRCPGVSQHGGLDRWMVIHTLPSFYPYRLVWQSAHLAFAQTRALVDAIKLHQLAD